MTTNDRIALCYRADVSDPGTARELQHRIIPALQREATELANCRRQCQPVPAWAADWKDAGMEDLEQRIHDAILEGMTRLAFDADPNPLSA
ncbi:MAG: hypothetical protein ACOC0M_00635 [Halomonas sp.]